MDASSASEDFSSSQETVNLLPRYNKGIDEHENTIAPERKSPCLEKIILYSILAGLIVGLNVLLGIQISPFLGSRFEPSQLSTVVNPSGMSKGISHDHGHEMEQDEYINCGNINSLESKIAHDCVFDVYLPGWVPRVCINDDLRNEFSKLPKFEWYLDEEKTKSIPESSLKEYWKFGSMVYSDPEYHVYHCAYTMRAMTASLGNTTRCFPKKFLNHKHTQHCIKVLKGTETNLVNEVHYGKDVECYVPHQ